MKELLSVNQYHQKLILTAMEMAEFYHRGQTRKYAGEPYVTHPIAVAEILASFGFVGDVIAAALLHDVVEDSDCTLEEVANRTNFIVARLVAGCTNDETLEGNRKARKEQQALLFAQGPPLSQNIKIADLGHNLPSICENEPGFGRKYLAEKKNLVNKLDKASPEMLLYAEGIFARCEEILGE